MSLVTVYNKEPRWISLSSKIDLAPGSNEVDADLLATVKEIEIVKYLFDSKSLTIVDANQVEEEKLSKPKKKAK